MDIIEITGFAAAALTTAANIPQALKIIRTKSAKDVSTLTYLLLSAGLALWVTYGIMQEDVPIILANVVSLLISATILTLKYLPRKTIDKIHDKAQ